MEKEEVRDYLLRNRRENILFLYDLEKLYPREVDFFIARDENNKIKGVGLIWFGIPNLPSIHLRADCEGVIYNLIKCIGIENNKNYRVILSRNYLEEAENTLRIFKSNIRRDYILLLSVNSLQFSFQSNYLSSLFPYEIRRITNKDVLNVRKLLEKNIDDKGLIEWAVTSVGREIFYGYFEGEKLLSIAGTLLRYEEIAIIGNVLTDKEYRRKGLATRVLTSLLSHLFEEGFKEAQLYVVENSPAYKLYKKLGFNEVGKYVRYML